MYHSNIREWLDSIGVDIKFSGTDVGPNDLNIDCPWCGKEKHLGIHRVHGWLNCWACNFEGRRKRPWLADLIFELEDISHRDAKEKALQLVKGYPDSEQDPETFARPSSTWLPDNCYEFFSVVKNGLQEFSQSMAREYLNSRGFDDSLIKKHKMLYTTVDVASNDPWRGRVIIPFLESNQIVCWAGRDYTGYANQRYRNCPAKQSLKRPKELLYGSEEFKQSQCKHARIVEGIFDKITIGPTALAVSKGGCSTSQLALLQKLGPASASVIFDPTTFDDWYSLSRAVELARNLTTFVKQVKVVRLTDGDVNELGWERVAAIEAATPLFVA
jgi:DNA primase